MRIFPKGGLLDVAKGERSPFGETFHLLDLGVRHKLLEDQLHPDVAEHHVKKRAHSPAGPPNQANLLPTVSLLRALHEDGINCMACTGANYIVQSSMLLNQALRR